MVLVEAVVVGRLALYATRSVGCPWCVAVRGTWTGSIWNDSVQVSRLGVNEIKLLGLQYGLFLRFGMFRCNVLCYGWEQGLKEPIQEDPVVKLYFT